MFSLFQIFKRKKPKARIFAGSITVVQPTGIKHFVSKMDSPVGDVADHIVREALASLINLPEKGDRASHQPGDLALDIVVPEFDLGAFLTVGPVPVTWRPGITLTARLFEIETGETKFATTVKHREAWHRWGKKVVSPGRYFGTEPLMSKEETERMTIAAATTLLTRISAAI